MFIKKAKLEGFRSYKSQKMEEFEFSEGQNLVLGLNGHGKSNLLLGKFPKTHF
jgi:chromosome segregation ATPase